MTGDTTGAERPIRTTRQLAAALLALEDLDPVEDAEACVELADVAREVLARRRRAAMLIAYEAGTAQTELARRFEVSRRVVTKRIEQARRERDEDGHDAGARGA